MKKTDNIFLNHKNDFIIIPLLNEGKSKALSMDSLINYFGADKREIVAQINRERLKGAPIIARQDSEGGYYLPENKTELNNYLSSLNARIKSLSKMYKSVRKNGNKYINKL